MQAERQPSFPRLYSLWGFRYCDLMLALAERAAWRSLALPSRASEPQTTRLGSQATLAACDEVIERAEEALKIAIEHNLSLLSIALDRLTLARAKLYRAILEPPDGDLSAVADDLHQALNGLRQANTLDNLPQALLTASLLATVREEASQSSDFLTEAQQIAERGPMPLYLADVWLYRARLRIAECRVRNEAISDSEIHDLHSALDNARTLIERHQYGRRLPELEDAEAALAALPRQPAVAPTPKENSGAPQQEAAMPSDTANAPIVVLLTVNDNETDQLLDTFIGAGQTLIQETRGITYHDLGLHGGLHVIHTLCEMGAVGIGAAQQRTQDAIAHWQPLAVIAVGIAFGIDETKQAIGDVLVSVQLQNYDLARINEDGSITPRGDKPHAADPLVNRLRQTDVRLRRGDDWPKVRFGLMLSGQKLVDNLDYRESLKRLWGEAIGGEMEGTGLYVSAQQAKVDWVVIKAICDWGHNKEGANTDAWQKTAAANAARVVKAALDAGELYPGASAANTMSDSAALQRNEAEGTVNEDPAGEDVADEDRLLETLEQLPSPWFEKLVFKFDQHNTIPSRGAQLERAIELLKLLRAIDRGYEKAIDEIARLKKRS